MGAFGSWPCEWCGQEVEDMSPHNCDVRDLKRRIEELKEQLENFEYELKEAGTWDDG